MLSWALAHAVSGRFEPYDSGSGFLVTQLILVGAALGLGIRRGVGSALLFVLGAYLGLNGYAYVFGGEDSRVWAPLGAISSLVLVALPLVAGLVGGGVRRRAARADSPEAEDT